MLRFTNLEEISWLSNFSNWNFEKNVHFSQSPIKQWVSENIYPRLDLLEDWGLVNNMNTFLDFLELIWKINLNICKRAYLNLTRDLANFRIRYLLFNDFDSMLLSSLEKHTFSVVNKQWLHCRKWQFLIAYLVLKWLSCFKKSVIANFLFSFFFFR